MAHQNKTSDVFRECTLGYRWELLGKSLQWQMYSWKSILVYLYSALNCWQSTTKLKWHALCMRYEYSSVTFSCVLRYCLQCTFFLLWSNPHLFPIVKKLIVCVGNVHRFQDMYSLENSFCGRKDAVQKRHCCTWKVTIIYPKKRKLERVQDTLAVCQMWVLTLNEFSEVWPVPDAVITVICAPDDGWSYHPKHVEQFTEI